MPLNFQCVYLLSARGASKGEIITIEGPDLVTCSEGVVRRLSSPGLWICGCWLRHMSLRGTCLQAELETRMLNLRPVFCCPDFGISETCREKVLTPFKPKPLEPEGSA